MSPMVEFIYDFVSLPSYIAWKALPPMLDAVGATLVTTPVVVTGIHKATGNPGPMAYPAKLDWYRRDLRRWCAKRDVPINPRLHVPFRSLPLLRGSVVAAERGETTHYVGAMFDAIFLHGRDFNDEHAFPESIHKARLDASAYLQGIERSEIKAQLRRNTEDAVARCVFGVPTFFVNGEFFRTRSARIRDGRAAGPLRRRPPVIDRTGRKPNVRHTHASPSSTLIGWPQQYPSLMVYGDE